MNLHAHLLVLACLATALSCQEDYHVYFGHGGNVVVEQPRNPSPDDGLTIACWFRSSARLRTPVNFVKIWPDQGKDDDKGLFAMSMSSSNSLVFALRNAEGKEVKLSGLGKWLDGKWHHAVATWNGASMSVYVDGKQLAQNEPAGFAPLATSTHPLVIGPVTPARSRRPILFDGCLGRVQLWRRALTADEIGSAGSEDHREGLLAHYPLRSRAPTDEARAEGGLRQAGVLTGGLARSGWVRTRSWSHAGAGPGLDFYCYDLADVVTGTGRRVLVENKKLKRVGVLWQDSESWAIAITWLDPELRSHETHALTQVKGMRLAGGTADDVGNVYYLAIEDAPRNRAAGFEVRAILHKARADGSGAMQAALDVSKAGTNIYDFSASALGSANMRYSKGSLGVILPRRMHKSRDGLKHQGAIALTFAVKDLKLTRNHGQTSGHSKANFLTVNKKGQFVALDLGDNYPRGVHLHAFDKGKRMSRLVYTFKTAHSTRPKDGMPVYDEISGDGQTFYKWSNDNAVYTELGGLVEGKKDYFIVFATDQGLDGRVLDNGRAFRSCDDPRNLALVRVVKDFGRAPGGSEVSNSLMASLPRKTKTETGGYYDFSGRWHKQRIVGVTWLTNYASGEEAHAPQLLKRANGNVLVIWEKTGDVLGLRAMELKPDGKVVVPEFVLPFTTKLNRQDHVINISSRTYILAGDRGGSQQRLFFVKD